MYMLIRMFLLVNEYFYDEFVNYMKFLMNSVWGSNNLLLIMVSNMVWDESFLMLVGFM